MILKLEVTVAGRGCYSHHSAPVIQNSTQELPKRWRIMRKPNQACSTLQRIRNCITFQYAQVLTKMTVFSLRKKCKKNSYINFVFTARCVSILDWLLWANRYVFVFPFKKIETLILNWLPIEATTTYSLYFSRFLVKVFHSLP